MTNLRNVYAQKALDQIPRLLSNLDRSPFSPTYGCFHRDYWLDKTSDFPDAVRQFAVHALALVYKYEMPDNIYVNQTKIRDYAIAGLDFWASIQHKDGSFDEFYPYERGWVGPSAFTCFTTMEAFVLLEDEIPADVSERVRGAIRKAAYFIAKGESEEDHLANHHAMACLALWKAYRLLGEPELKTAYDQAFETFLTYHNSNEGWSREYDGVDPGYLSATVSFFGKIYQDNPDPTLLKILQESVEFAAYFVYPNGFYAGSMGSRNTLHFYCHGFEILANEIPLAGAIAEKMLIGLDEGKLVPPAIISDRYVVYRVPEFLQSYVDYTERAESPPPLPYERPPFTQYFPESRIFVSSNPQRYLIANLAKGGVVKIFDGNSGALVFNDCGLIGQTDDNKIVSSQWVDPTYECEVTDSGWAVRGQMHIVPSTKLFNPAKNILFRSTLVALGWNPTFSHLLKGQIRKMLILGQRSVPIQFERRLQIEQDESDNERLTLEDTIELGEKVTLQSLSVGDEFFVRHVPQSRYFQPQELDVDGYELSPSELAQLNSERTLAIQTVLSDQQKVETHQVISGSQASIQVDSSIPLPMGVYDVDYFEGRQTKRQLIYRLERRTDEVEAAIRRYSDSLKVVVDIGTADALMLEKLRTRLDTQGTMFVGLDYSISLLQTTSLPNIYKLQSDALALPIASDSTDVIIATAIIEHVPDAKAMLQECMRILRPGGIMVATTPDPTMEHISSTIGLLKDAGHQETFNLRQLRTLFETSDFQVLETKKFMFSPIGFPAEKQIERFFGPLGLSLIMANQLIIAKK
ncbi:MAG: methyltransferase domain-containing protein [Chloroflexota bacterium]